MALRAALFPLANRLLSVLALSLSFSLESHFCRDAQAEYSLSVRSEMSNSQMHHFERPSTSVFDSDNPSRRDCVSDCDPENDVTMCICPVCGFSATSPPKLDEHMDTAHGDGVEAGGCSAVTSSTPKRSAPDGFNGYNYCTDSSDSPPRGDCMEEAPKTQSSSLLQPADTASSSSSPPQSTSMPLIQNVSLQTDSRRRYRCSMCASTFPWHGDLTDHLKAAHGVQKNSRESARGGSTASGSGASGRSAGAFCCKSCKYVAKYQSELRRHMRLHWGLKPFECVFCSYRSAWKGDLKRHMESHHKERFASEAELVRIMAQFKNNAGTSAIVDIGGGGGGGGDQSPNSHVDSPTRSLKRSPASRNGRERGARQSMPLPTGHAERDDDLLHHQLFPATAAPVTTQQQAQFSVQPQITFDQLTACQQTQPPNHATPFMGPSPSPPHPLPPLGLFPSPGQYSNLIGPAAPMFAANSLLCNPEVVKAILSQTPEHLNNLILSQQQQHLQPTTTEEPLNLVCKQEAQSLTGRGAMTTPNSDVRPPPAKRRSIAPSSVGASYVSGGGGGGGLREEQWKRYQCSGCGHRSNWKWDINKHIKVAHPERKEITTITLDIEEARLTLPAYLEKVRALGRNGRPSATGAAEEWGTTSTGNSIVSGHQPTEGYYRPFKCTVCGHRSNWKWDVKKHIKQMHAGAADVITLSNEEARRTINQYKSHRRQGQGLRSHWSASSSSASMMTAAPATVKTSPPTKRHLDDSDSADVDESQPNREPLDEQVAPASAFRCTVCKRRFQTWTNLQQHTVFSHPSGGNSAVSSGASAVSPGGGSSGSNVCKRSYKKALLQKALASPTASRLSPWKNCQPTMVTKTPAMQRLQFTENSPPIQPSVEDCHKFQARRSLLAEMSPTLPLMSPLRPSTHENLLSGGVEGEQKAIQDPGKVFQLIELLQQVLNFLISTLDDDKQRAADTMKLSSDTSEETPSLTGTSSDENENEPSTSLDKSERLANLLQQPQVQPLVNQLSSLFHLAIRHDPITSTETPHPAQ
uniref:C2H2-type domain-containing protein n=1 Tax=Mesocestoides corti TaxID=53468 RepID=A0A5K3FSS7_MESCO